MAIEEALHKGSTFKSSVGIGAICLLLGLLLGQNVGSANVFDIAGQLKGIGEQPAQAAAVTPTVPAPPKAPAQ